HTATHGRVWQVLGRKCGRCKLDDAAGGDDVSRRDPINLSPFHLLEETAHNKRFGLTGIIVQRRKYRHESEPLRSLYAFERSRCEFGPALIECEKAKAALNFRSVLVDQSLEARIVAKRVPHRVQFQHRYCDSIRSLE